MRPLPPQARAQFGAFTVAQAAAAGWTSHALCHAVAVERIERVRVGVYGSPVTETDPYLAALGRLRREAVAFALSSRGVPLSHASSAAVHGLTLLRTPDHVCATYRRGGRGPMPGVHRHRGRLPDTDCIRHGPMVLTRPARSVVELGHELGPDAAITAADSVLRLGLAATEQLDDVLSRTADWPGIVGAQRAIRLADGRAESALESVSRLRMSTCGIPAPDLQPRILTVGGVFLGRCDFYWDGPGVVGEADGMGKYDDRPLSLRDEKQRQAALERAGLVVVRWSWDDLADFRRTRFELLSAFGRGIRPDRAPRRWRAERCHTPGGPQLRTAS